MPAQANADGGPANRRAFSLLVAAAGLILVVAGLAGYTSAGLGFGMLFAAGGSLVFGVLVFAVIALTRGGDEARLTRASGILFRVGAVGYILAVCVLAGHYIHETLQGRMEFYWMLFGPVVLVALFSVEAGLYRKLVKVNFASWQRFRHFLRREDSDPLAMRNALVDEVIFQKPLWRTSRIRWLRHALIFWGFAGMFLTEVVAVVLREGFPAFGWRDIWREAGHPVRLVFDFAYDMTGLMMLVGCLLALAWRAGVGNRPEKKFSDTPMVVFLLMVVTTGFVMEGWRIAQAPLEAAHASSFAGVAFARIVIWAGISSPALFQPLWIVHAVLSCALIAWLPATRLVHSCATPVGRLMNSQKGLLAARKQGVLGGMLRRQPNAPASRGEGTPATR